MRRALRHGGHTRLLTPGAAPLLLLLRRFRRGRLCATPQTAAHQAPRPWDSPGKNTGVCCHFLLQCMKVRSESEVALLCLTLSDPVDCSPSGSSVHGIFQARVLEWGAIAFSEGLHINYKKGQDARSPEVVMSAAGLQKPRESWALAVLRPPEGLT